MEMIDPIFNMNKIKFDILDKWNLIDNKTSRVNVYINLDNVFKILLTPRINNFIQASSSINDSDDYMNYVTKSIVSNIINLGQHYRLWLAKQSKESRIILFWSNPIESPRLYINSKYNPGYREDYLDKYCISMDNSHIVKAITDAVKFCKTCIQYVNEVYLVESGIVEASLIPYILYKEFYSKDGTSSTNILVSGANYDLSYVSYGFTVLCPSYRKKSPYIVNSNNVIEVMKQKLRVSSVLSVKSNFVEFILSLLGDKDRDIPSILGVGIVTILKMVSTAIDKGLISEDTKDVDMLSGIIKEDYREIFRRNYHCFNLEYQMNDLEPLDIHKITSQLVDKYDEVTLNEMNEKYFKLCPIEIIRPKSEQVLYNDNPYNRSIFANKK